MPNSFGTLRKLNDDIWFHCLPALGDALGVSLDRMPVSLKVLLENLVRHEDDFTVTRVTSSSIYYTAHQTGSSQPARDMVGGADWSLVRNVNGKETLVNQPMAFPLTAGKSWTIEYHEDHPNKAHRFEEWKTVYTVVGAEKVTVPAGTFDTIKVEAEGHWRAELEPSNTVVQGAQTTPGATSMITEARKVTAQPIEGRTYKAFWYVPSQRRWVKSVEEYYAGNGVRNERYTSELESSKLAD